MTEASTGPFALGARRLALICIGAAAIMTIADPPREPAEFAQPLRDGPGVFNHPVHVSPSPQMTIPAGWPLDTSGTITCATCHTELPQGGAGDDPRLRDWNPSRAETRDFTPFCRNCHTDRNPASAAAVHWLGVQRAHVTPQHDTGQPTGAALDFASRRCLECHDGVSASEALNTGGSSRPFSIMESGMNHPIGVRYPGVANVGRGSRYRPAGLLPKEVDLSEGVVSCLSCHNLYAAGRNHLTVPIEGSDLCFTCHDMR